ncbi:glycosyltransferase family 2 protein [Halobacillus fulvus]|nr:glycosyltransferase family 2 protein [Halobacillus fulvus]
MPKISVIIAAYNAQLYVERAIKSILNQTYQNFEIIVCDDNSTDNTYDILVNLSTQDERIKVLKNEINMKAAYTRNRCLEHCNGTYIAIQDSDDFSHPSRLKEQISYLEQNRHIDFVSSRMYKVQEDIQSSQYNKWPKTQYKLPYIEYPKNKDFLKRLPYAHAATMFKKCAVDEVMGYRVSKETVRGQDADLFIRLHSVGKRGHNLNKYLYYYFEGENAFKRKKFKYQIDACKIRYKGYKKLKLLPMGYIFALKPLLSGLLPRKIIRR